MFPIIAIGFSVLYVLCLAVTLIVLSGNHPDGE